MITVLRIGHRPARDKRVTTHVALTARAFGAGKVLVDRRDPPLEKTVRDVVRRFGGPFEIETGVPWRRVLREFRGTKVHLTMYGLRLEEALPTVPRDDLLLIVGAEKVPAEVYRLAGCEFNLNSPKHLGAILFDQLNLPAPARRGSPPPSARQARAPSLPETRAGPRGGRAPAPARAPRSWPRRSRRSSTIRRDGWRWRTGPSPMRAPTASTRPPGSCCESAWSATSAPDPVRSTKAR